MLGLHQECPGVVKQVHGLHQGNPRVLKVEVGLHHGCPSSDHRSPTVVMLVMGLQQGCSVREHEVSQGGETSDVASRWESQEGGVHDGTSPWDT